MKMLYDGPLDVLMFQNTRKTETKIEMYVWEYMNLGELKWRFIVILSALETAI